MKLHKHLVDQTLDAIFEIFTGDLYADKVIEKFFKQNRKWGSRDRKFFAETVYDLVRFKNKFLGILGVSTKKSIVKGDVYLIWLCYFFQKEKLFPDWAEQEDCDLVAAALRQNKKLDMSTRVSFPEWLVAEYQKTYQGKTEDVLNSLNQVAPFFLRVNELKTTKTKLQQELAAEGISSEIVPDVESALLIPVRKNVFITKAFQSGFFEVQDGGSQQIAPFLKVQPGMRVVDACAGAGGKSLHLAVLMKNKGKLISMDIHERKLKELRTRASRNSIDIIETKLIDGSKTIKRLEKSFDRVLLDVPCSGSGVIRRNPDSKWKLKLDDLNELVKTQADILSSYSKMMKPDGYLVYATCSLFEQENEDQIKKFLSSNSGWVLEEELKINPMDTSFDGFYMARLKLKN